MAEYLSERELRVLRRERIREIEEVEQRERLLNNTRESLLTIDQTAFESDNEERNKSESRELSFEIAKLDDKIRQLNEEQIITKDKKTKQVEPQREVREQSYNKVNYENDDFIKHSLELKEREQNELKRQSKKGN